MELTGAQMILESLVREGVQDVFGLPGGANLPLYDALPEFYPKIRHYLVRHEQAAAHAADAYARVAGKPGVCFATSGPGATNIVTGIANAWMDSVPLVCITGAVITALLGRDGFQEADITGITIPITKYNRLVLDAAEIPRAIREAFFIANTGRPSNEALTRYAAEHKQPLELGTLDPESESVLGRFWCSEIARHDRRRLSFAVWSVLSQRLLHDAAGPVQAIQEAR